MAAILQPVRLAEARTSRLRPAPLFTFVSEHLSRRDARNSSGSFDCSSETAGAGAPRDVMGSRRLDLPITVLNVLVKY
jgi:hypothetical protein